MVVEIILCAFLFVGFAWAMLMVLDHKECVKSYTSEDQEFFLVYTLKEAGKFSDSYECFQEIQFCRERLWALKDKYYDESNPVDLYSWSIVGVIDGSDHEGVILKEFFNA